jgi:hypothetical protein
MSPLRHISSWCSKKTPKKYRLFYISKIRYRGVWTLALLQKMLNTNIFISDNWRLHRRKRTYAYKCIHIFDFTLNFKGQYLLSLLLYLSCKPCNEPSGSEDMKLFSYYYFVTVDGWNRTRNGLKRGYHTRLLNTTAKGIQLSLQEEQLNSPSKMDRWCAESSHLVIWWNKTG